MNNLRVRITDGYLSTYDLRNILKISGCHKLFSDVCLAY